VAPSSVVDAADACHISSYQKDASIKHSHLQSAYIVLSKDISI